MSQHHPSPQQSHELKYALLDAIRDFPDGVSINSFYATFCRSLQIPVSTVRFVRALHDLESARLIRARDSMVYAN